MSIFEQSNKIQAGVIVLKSNVVITTLSDLLPLR